VLNNDLVSLTPKEEDYMKRFIVPETEIEKIEEKVKRDFADGVLEGKRRRLTMTADKKYLPLSYIPACTTRVERLFSSAKFIAPQERGKMNPINFEMVVYLKTNRRFWTIDLLTDIEK